MSLTFNAYVTDFTVKCQWHNCSKVDSFFLFLVRHSLFSPVKPPFRVLFCEFPMSRPFTFCKEYSLSVEGCSLGDVDEMHRLLSASLRGCPHWRTTFRAQRAIASISREKSLQKSISREKPLLKSIRGGKSLLKIFMLLLCDLCDLARKNIPRQLLFSCKVVWIFLAEPQSLLSRGVIASEN